MAGYTSSIVFQSTPPAEARGDILTLFDAISRYCVFQSTPSAEARGDQTDNTFLLFF